MANTPLLGDNNLQDQTHCTSASTNIPTRTSKQQGNDLYGSEPERYPQTETPPTAPSQQRIDEVCAYLYNSIKVVAVSDCPKHPARTYCDCPAGIASLRPSDIRHCKINLFRLFWDIQILGACEGAWDYDGSQASHHVFVGKVGKTPKHFARAFLKEGGGGQIGVLFQPTSKLSETVQAMVDYWIVRNSQWKATYSSREEAEDKWPNDAYDVASCTTKLSDIDLMEWEKAKGGAVHTVEYTYGPPGHKCVIHTCPFGDVGAGFAIKLLGVKSCHQPCPITDPLYKEALRVHVVRILKRYGKEPGPSGRLTFNHPDEIREMVGRKKSSKPGGGGALSIVRYVECEV
ncbi:hypothetical protein LTR37_002533 [Vermiconidia calcicola]|uniref:Uncharacterized protein n=1 Tax=Vermiconidia calcicola TaxID=1690605 RepID=A0ACC3NUA4_9PEZI|nr:hypothetical protein LTR37_002533 [Vermiconidia calcicola]